MTFRLSLPSVLFASFATAFALAACSGEVAGTPNYGGSSGGGSSGSPYGGGSCAGVCMRVIQLPCSGSTQTVAQCESSCAKAVTRAAMVGCTSQFNAVLGCYQNAPITCNMQGNPDVSACAASITALDRCAMPPPPGCGAIPYPTGGTTTCSAFGPGFDGGPSNTVTCQDGSGNTWTSTCNGTTCSCGYNGQAYCSCTTDGGPTLCCPGT
jgi:hypothetical protein